MNPEDYVAALERAGADPTLPTHVLVGRLRALGMHGGDKRLRSAVRLFRAPVMNRDGWMSRTQAALRLGVTVQRVDQLRREGRLAWESVRRYQRVRVSSDSVERYALDRVRNGPGPSGL